MHTDEQHSKGLHDGKQYLYDGCMLGQEHVQGHSSSMNQNVNMGAGQGLSLLLQGLPCIPMYVLCNANIHMSLESRQQA